jgi:putative spermidine/putrescine transport system ATP-binding protein
MPDPALSLTDARLTLRGNAGPVDILRGITLSVVAGESVGLVGPSGSGKSSLLMLMGGLEQATGGEVRVLGQDLTRMDEDALARFRRNNMGVVFQSFHLIPTMTAWENVATPLELAGARDAFARAGAMLDAVGLSSRADHYPAQLSGGEQQRVALARALAPRPRVLLLDEPLSALDAKVRVRLRGEIREIQQRLGITTIFVTHDQEEALSISDRVVVMNAGIADQVGTPFEIYNRPATPFVASFVGTLTPFEARVLDPAIGTVSSGGLTLNLGRPLPAQEGATLPIALRPEAVQLGRASGREIVLPATAHSVEFMGSVIRVRAEAAGQTFLLDTFNRPDTPPPQPGEPVEISFSGRDVIVIGA